ncbi:MFS transporter [Leucobacter sp. CSA1]|uniref:MFS transporter n=1 Tax=Leucobacter chromiisoli TaxID=2796471 RepID=A0A934Q4I4_9MICO|nr:MFS transporter [Leucobacter chromiisoli]MBK0417473.1 MFS transporter [Leucobacter chromiisoli]
MTEPLSLPRAFWLLFLATLVSRIGFFVESFLTIFMTDGAGFSASRASLVMALYGIGGAITALLCGPLIDRLGSRTVITIALALTGTAAGSLALIPPDWLVAPIVLAMGAFGQVIMPASNSLIANLARREHQRRAYGFMYMALNSGLALGPLIGGWLSSFSFTAMFSTGMALLYTGTFLAWLIGGGGDAVDRADAADRAGADERAGADDRAGAVDRNADRAGRALGAAARPGASRARLRPPSGFAVVARDRVFLAFALTNILYMGVYLQVFVTLPLLMLADGLGTTGYGLLMAINGVLVVSMQIPFDRMLARFGIPPLLIVAAALIAVGMGLNMFASSLWGYVLVLVVWTSSELINMPLSASVSAGIAHPSHRGVYLSVHGMGFPAGMAVASLIGGFAFAVLDDPKALWMIVAGLGAIVVALRILTAPAIRARLNA